MAVAKLKKQKEEEEAKQKAKEEREVKSIFTIEWAFFSSARSCVDYFIQWRESLEQVRAWGSGKDVSYIRFSGNNSLEKTQRPENCTVLVQLVFFFLKMIVSALPSFSCWDQIYLFLASSSPARATSSNLPDILFPIKATLKITFLKIFLLKFTNNMLRTNVVCKSSLNHLMVKLLEIW